MGEHSKGGNEFSTNTQGVSRRELVRLGALTFLAGAVAPISRRDRAWAQNSEVCNPDPPATPSDALTALIAGNARWASGSQQHPGEDTSLRACLANNSQAPFASILSCCDSRVPPELVFDQGLGQLCVARVAGNTFGAGQVSTLLFGPRMVPTQLRELPTQLLFVMGHSDCDTISSVAANFSNITKIITNGSILANIASAVSAAIKFIEHGGGNPQDLSQVVPVAIEQNVILTVKRFRKFLRPGPDLLIAGGVYDLSTQVVSVLIS